MSIVKSWFDRWPLKCFKTPLKSLTTAKTPQSSSKLTDESNSRLQKSSSSVFKRGGEEAKHAMTCHGVFPKTWIFSLLLSFVSSSPLHLPSKSSR